MAFLPAIGRIRVSSSIATDLMPERYEWICLALDN
jgi:hypothetical protein